MPFKIGPLEIVLILIIIGIWAGLFWAAYRFIRFLIQKNTTDNAVNVAKERYARGEITREEFEEIKRNIS